MIRGGRNLIKIIIIVLIIIALIFVAVYFEFWYTKKCYDYTCFNKAVYDCKNAFYIDEAKEATWQNTILGKEEDNCIINVKLLMVKQGDIESKSLEGKEMDCYLSMTNIKTIIEKGQNIAPHEDLKICHGLLKEDMQELMIKNLWAVVIKNLGQIQEESIKPL